MSRYSGKISRNEFENLKHKVYQVIEELKNMEVEEEEEEYEAPAHHVQQEYEAPVHHVQEEYAVPMHHEEEVFPPQMVESALESAMEAEAMEGRKKRAVCHRKKRNSKVRRNSLGRFCKVKKSKRHARK